MSFCPYNIISNDKLTSNKPSVKIHFIYSLFGDQTTKYTKKSNILIHIVIGSISVTPFTSHQIIVSIVDVLLKYEFAEIVRVLFRAQ